MRPESQPQYRGMQHLQRCFLRLRAILEKMDVCLLLCIFAGLMIAGLWANTISQLNRVKQNTLREAQRDAISLSRAFKEHATRTVEGTDQAIVYLRHRYNIVGKNLDIASDLQNALEPENIYNLFTIVDKNGDIVLSSEPFHPMNLSDREHIKVHMASDQVGLYISKPVLGRVSKKWSLQMTRRINNPDGSFKGVVVASVDPQYFSKLYKDIDVGKQGSISLIGMDGTIRVRHVGDDDSMGQDISGGALFKALQGQEKGVVRIESMLDQRQRVYAFQKLNRYPLYVSVGIDIDERLTDYRTSRTQALWISSLTTVIILLFTGALISLIGRLMASRQEALAANRAKLHFLSNISHEFRTPLNGILGYSESLMEDFAGTPQGKFAYAIHESGLRLLTLVDAVLELSTLKSGKTALHMSNEKLEDIAMHAIGRQREAADRKQLAISFVIAPDLPKVICCDRSKLLQALDKLLDNAVRFTAQGSVRLEIERDAERIVFKVIDTGPGIHPSKQEQIFEKFVQVDDTAARGNDGAGLGLTLASLLVERMNGTIELQSTPGEGSVFSFSLPLIIETSDGQQDDN